jgi:hypothetical protein
MIRRGGVGSEGLWESVAGRRRGWVGRSGREVEATARCVSEEKDRSGTNTGVVLMRAGKQSM